MRRPSKPFKARQLDPSIVVKPLRKGLFGECKKNGKIFINVNQPPREFLDTAIHELLHRYFPQLSEDAVRDTANDMAMDLWALNYRRVEQ